ncbi:MAG: hypothetical protein EHM58_16140 [Ignavibacteriae bacterium]|nr:MAG: hypothetical protein EHM58_16140 [Ignavibacteriota bacterium]
MHGKLNKIFNKHTLFFISFFALISQRFFHFGKVIEEPMSWRQFDTEFFAYAYFRNGINLFKPSVCWLGAHKTLILEFPLISAIISVFYDMFGHSVVYARLVIFIFFLASAIYLYLLVKYFYYRRLAAITVFVYFLIPLSVYYSRSINIDFPVLFFSLAALYYYVLGFEKENIYYIALASFLSLLGYLTKAPYIFYIFIPLLYLIICKKQFSYFFKTFILIITPVIIFIIWQKYSIGVNSNAPDWYFIPGYLKFDDMWSWYFGNFSDRLNLEFWKKLIFRIVSDEITYIGLPLFITGLFVKPETYKFKKFFLFYSIGAIIYLLIFFTLNVIHDYYQVPLIVIFSFIIAKGIDNIYKRLKNNSPVQANLVTGFILIVLIINGIWYTERWFYKQDKLRYSTAEFINKNTSDSSLVISSIDQTDPRDPTILAPSYRYGWSVRTMDLNPKLINLLKAEGANYLAIVSDKNLNAELTEYLENYNKQEIELPKVGWKLLFYKLK